MASASELPLPLFLEQSSSFCSCLENDINQFINEIENSFLSVNRTVKVAPRQRRKKGGNPGSCTLDLTEFKTSKGNVLHKLQGRFETMELKWFNDIAELKGWFLQKIETCLSKMQLEIKVSAEDLNLLQSINDVELCEERSDSNSEVDKTSVDEPLDSRFHAANPPASSHSTIVYSQDMKTSGTSGPTGDATTDVFEGNVGSPQATNLPSPVNAKKTGRRGTGRGLVKNVADSTKLKKNEIINSTIPEEQSSKSRGTHLSDTLHSSNNIDTNAFQENESSLHAVSPPHVENAKEMGKKRGRGQMKRVAHVAKLSSIPESDELPVRNKRPNYQVTDVSCTLSSPDNIDTNGFQEDTGLVHINIPPPLENAKKGGRGRMQRGVKGAQLSSEVASDSSIPNSNETVGRGRTKRGVKDAQLSSEVASDSSIPNSNETVGRGRMKRGVKGAQLSSEVASDSTIPNCNETVGRGRMKRVVKGTQLNKEVASDSNVPDSCVDELVVRNKRSNRQGAEVSALGYPNTINGNDFQEDTGTIDAAIPPPRNAKKVGKRGAGVRGQMKRGAKTAQLNEEEIVDNYTVPGLGVEEPAIKSKVSDEDITCASVPRGITSANIFQENTDSLQSASLPPPAKPVGKRKTGRPQVQKGVDVESTIPDSAIGGRAFRSKVSGLQGIDTSRTLGSSEGAGSSVLQESLDSFHSASSHRPSNTKKMGKKEIGRARLKQGVNATHSSQQVTTYDVSTPIIEPALRSKMSDWQGILGASGRAPSRPGLYEVKVWRAKNPAYIGHTDDILKSFILFREGEPSGEKHLDQFIRRNQEQVCVRYEIYPSVQLAKLEQKKRLKEFLEKHRNLPSYNYGL